MFIIENDNLLVIFLYFVIGFILYCVFDYDHYRASHFMHYSSLVAGAFLIFIKCPFGALIFGFHLAYELRKHSILNIQ
jgi:hypothetical protein